MDLRSVAYSVGFKVNDDGILTAERHMKDFEAQTIKTFNTFESAAEKANNKIKTFADNSLHELGGHAKRFGGTWMRRVTAPIAGGASAAIYFGSQYDGVMANVQAVTGATDEEITILKDNIKDIDGIFTRIDLGNVSETFARSGIRPDAIGEVLEPATDAATANAVEVDLTASMSIEGSNIFKRDIKDSEKMLDLFTNTAAKSNTDLHGLNETMVYAGSAYSSLGYDMEDFAFSVGVLANEGLHGSMAGTGLRSAITKLAAPTSTGQKTMKKYGISIRNAQGEMRSFPDMIENLRSSLGGLEEDAQMAALTDIFGIQGATVIQKFVNTSEENIETMRAATTDYVGATAEMKEIIEDSSAYKLQKLKTDGINLLVDAFELMEPTVSAVVSGLSTIFQYVNELGPVSKYAIGISLTGLALLGPAIWGIGSLMQAMAFISIASNMGIMASFAGVAASIWTAAAPLLPFIGLALAIGYTAYKIRDNWDELSDYWDRFINWSDEKFDKLGDRISDSLISAADWVTDKWTEFTDWVSSLPQKARDKANEAKENILEKLEPVTSFFDNLMEKARDVGWALSNPLEAIKGKFEGKTINELRVTDSFAGSYKTGINKVPEDDHKSILHKGEMVLTEPTAEKYRQLGGTKDNLPSLENQYIETETEEYYSDLENQYYTSEEYNKYEEYSPENSTVNNNNSISYNPTYTLTVEGGGDLGLKTKYELERLIKKLQVEGMEDFFYTLRMRTE